MRTIDVMATLLRKHMDDNGITQAHLSRLIGRTPKHVNQVLNGKCGTGELDYWAFVLGLKYTVQLSFDAVVVSGGDTNHPDTPHPQGVGEHHRNKT